MTEAAWQEVGHGGNVAASQSGRQRHGEKYHCFSFSSCSATSFKILAESSKKPLGKETWKIQFTETEQEMNLLTYSSAVASEHSAYYTVDMQ